MGWEQGGAAKFGFHNTKLKDNRGAHVRRGSLMGARRKPGRIYSAATGMPTKSMRQGE